MPRAAALLLLPPLAGSSPLLPALPELKDRYDAAQAGGADVAVYRPLLDALEELEAKVADTDHLSKYFWRLQVDVAGELRNWSAVERAAWGAVQNRPCQEDPEGCFVTAIASGITACFRQDQRDAASELFDYGRSVKHPSFKWTTVDQMPSSMISPKPSQPFWEAAGVALARRLEAAFPDILRELDALLPPGTPAPAHFKKVRGGDYTRSRQQDFLSNARDLCDALEPAGPQLPSGVPCWEEFMFYAAEKNKGKTGHWIDEHCALTPRTCEALQDPALIGDIGLGHVGVPGKASFVMLHPNSKIAAHTGAHNARLTVHLGLRVPAGSYIEARGERRSWEVGKAMVLDDSFFHHVANPTAEDRVILLAHVWHPDLVAEQGGIRPGATAPWVAHGRAGDPEL